MASSSLRLSHPTVEATPCPKCGEKKLHLEIRLKAAPIGSFSLAGQATKFSATETVWLVCDGCGVESEAKSDA